MKRSDLIVFLGPTLSRTEASQVVAAEFWPPAAQGDVFRALTKKPKVLVLIDGVFESSPSVWHHELMSALEAGVAVFGASSMGALRAAELWTHGMLGVGEVFEGYRKGLWTDDADVALLHADAEHDFMAFTVPLVNVRHAVKVARARKVLSVAEAERMLAVASGLFYQERTWRTVLAGARLSPAALERWKHFEKSGLPDLKADDARAVLKAAGEFLRSGAPGVRPLTRRHFPSHVRRQRLAVRGASSSSPQEAKAGTLKLLLAAWARGQGMKTTFEERQAASLQLNPRVAEKLDAAELEHACETWALCEKVLRLSQRMVPDGPSWAEGAEFERLWKAHSPK